MMDARSNYPGLDVDDMNSSAAPGSLFCDFLVPYMASADV